MRHPEGQNRMSDDTSGTGKRPGAHSGGHVKTLASQALSEVMGRTQSSDQSLNEAYIVEIAAALRAFDPEVRRALLERMRRAGVSAESICDIYIPEVARRLGDAWCVDEVSFADVTIQSARLQSMLRDLELSWRYETTFDPNAPSVLMIVRRDEYHTLGAMVASSHLRRKGVYVRLSMGQSLDEIGDLVRNSAFDCVMISSSACEKLESVRKLVKTIRTNVDGNLPIVVGGSAVSNEKDTKNLTGADHVTSDPEEALRLCRLKIPGQTAGSSVIGT